MRVTFEDGLARRGAGDPGRVCDAAAPAVEAYVLGYLRRALGNAEVSIRHQRASRMPDQVDLFDVELLAHLVDELVHEIGVGRVI